MISHFLFLTCMSSSGFAQDLHWIFTYEEAGGPPFTTHLIVEVSDDGVFQASTEGMPIQESGLTKRDVTKRISVEEVSHFVALAMDATDFTINPEQPWPDCRWAEMMVIKGREKIMRRSGCIDGNWSKRKHTRRLLEKIGSYLPSEMRVRP
jgi:hypothetical protein